MKKRILLILFMSVWILYLASCTDLSYTNTQKRVIIIFVDYYIKNLEKNKKLWKDKLAPIVEYISDLPIEIKIFPLYAHTENANPIIEATFEPDAKIESETLKKAKFKKSLRIFFDVDSSDSVEGSLKESIKRFTENDRAQSNLSRIIASIDVLKKLFSQNQWQNENVVIIYISDMIERHSPPDESKGRFDFLEPDGITVNHYSLKEASEQLERENSWLAGVIEDFPKGYTGTKVYNIRPFFIHAQAHIEEGDTYLEIEKFWKKLFQKIGLKIYLGVDYEFIFGKK